MVTNRFHYQQLIYLISRCLHRNLQNSGPLTATRDFQGMIPKSELQHRAENVLDRPLDDRRRTTVRAKLICFA